MARLSSGGNKPVVPVRFPPSLAVAAEQAAGDDDMTLSAWIRWLVTAELARRAGACPACGQLVPQEGS